MKAVKVSLRANPFINHRAEIKKIYCSKWLKKLKSVIISGLCLRKQRESHRKHQNSSPQRNKSTIY